MSVTILVPEKEVNIILPISPKAEKPKEKPLGSKGPPLPRPIPKPRPKR